MNDNLEFLLAVIVAIASFFAFGFLAYFIDVVLLGDTELKFLPVVVILLFLIIAAIIGD